MTTPGVENAATRPLVRRHGVSLWRQIASRLQQDVSTGVYPPASRLPTEARLSAQFHVNRHTVRRALEELSRAGLVRVEQGRGSFVTEDLIEYTVGARTRFAEWIRRQNKEPSGRVLDLREIVADEAIAAGLGVRRGTRVILFERLGMADARPVSLTRHHFAASRHPGLLQALHGASSITEALRQVGVDDYLRQATRVSARMPSADEATLLAMARASPVLVTENVNVDNPGGGVEFGVGLHPTPRVQVVFEP